MKLQFIYVPTNDLAASLSLYRDTLGFDEVWREGDLTVGLAIADNEAAVMIDAAAHPGSGPGPIYAVEHVDEWLDGKALDIFLPPFDIPGGRLMGFRDGDGNAVYVMDQSTSDE